MQLRVKGCWIDVDLAAHVLLEVARELLEPITVARHLNIGRTTLLVNKENL